MIGPSSSMVYQSQDQVHVSEAAMIALHDLSAHELSTAYRTRRLSPVEVTRAVLSRIDAWEKRINAMYVIDAAGALAMAAASQERWRRRKPLSPLDGVPITIKDNIAVKGIPAPFWHRGRRHDTERLRRSPDGPRAGSRLRFVG
jgi:hypothetical protein